MTTKPNDQTTLFRPGEILLCELEWTTVRVIYDGRRDEHDCVLVGPENDPNDGWFTKPSDLRRLDDAR